LLLRSLRLFLHGSDRLFLLPMRPPPPPTLFPYTTLFRSRVVNDRRTTRTRQHRIDERLLALHVRQLFGSLPQALGVLVDRLRRADRKSTRLNSSHVKISYAVFCLQI